MPILGSVEPEVGGVGDREEEGSRIGAEYIRVGHWWAFRLLCMSQVIGTGQELSSRVLANLPLVCSADSSIMRTARFRTRYQGGDNANRYESRAGAESLGHIEVAGSSNAREEDVGASL